MNTQDIARALAEPLPTWPRAAVIGTRGEGTIAYWNAGAERLYGRRAADAVGRDFLDVIPPDLTRARSAEIMAYLQAGLSFAGERTPTRRNGLPLRIFVLAFPIGDLAHGRGAIVTVSVPRTQRHMIWPDATRLHAEVSRRFADGVARYGRRRLEPPVGLAPRTAQAPRLWAYAPVTSALHLAALHGRSGVSLGHWPLMQRVETYRLRAERILGPGRRPRQGEVVLARMWLRLAEQFAARRS